MDYVIRNNREGGVNMRMKQRLKYFPLYCPHPINSTRMRHAVYLVSSEGFVTKDMCSEWRYIGEPLHDGWFRVLAFGRVVY